MKHYHVYGIGNALVDTEFSIEDSFLTDMQLEKGVMTLVEYEHQQALSQALTQHTPKRAGGGSAANTLFAIQHLGGQCFYACRVANDATGDFYRTDLQQAGIDTLKGKRPSGTSGQCLVLITPDAERTMQTFLGVSQELSTQDIDPHAIAQSDYVYLEGYLTTSESALDAAVKTREIAEAQGVKTALTFSDPNIVRFFKPQLERLLGTGVDLLFCNQQEAFAWCDTDQIDTAVATLKTLAKNFVITLGAQGALAFDGQTLHTIAPHPVTPLDTNGAGDLFAGAYLYALTHGQDHPSAGALASRACAQLITQFGPRLSQQALQTLKTNHPL